VSRTYHDMPAHAAQHARERDAERAYVTTWRAEVLTGSALPAAAPLFPELSAPEVRPVRGYQLDAFTLDLFTE
jgi:hypothetical protein